MMNDFPTLAQVSQELGRGDLALAERTASAFLQRNAASAEGWFLRGLAAHLAGNLAIAMDSYQKSLQLAPDYTDPLNNLCAAYLTLDRVAEGAALGEQFVRRCPNDPIANCNYANALVRLGRRDEAADHYRRALVQKPDYGDVLVNLGALLLDAAQPQEAVGHLKLAVRLQPDSGSAHSNLGLGLFYLEQFEAAAHHLREALRINPRNADALINLGTVVARLGQYEQAIECYRHAIAVRPHDALAHDNLGTALNALRQSDESISLHERAIELQPNLVSAHCNLGKTLAEHCRFDEAEARLIQALEIQPDHAETHNLLGMVYFHTGREDKAEQCLNEALRLGPNLLRARINRAFLLLRRGDFARGLPDYELRFQAFEPFRSHKSITLWDGSDLVGQTILLTGEQGLGDILQFLRFVPLVKAKGGRVICELPAKILPIARCGRGFDELIAKGAPLPATDVQASLLSLPYLLGTTEAPEPHIEADPALVKSWGERLQTISGFRIGIAWQGDPGFRFDRIRSVPLKHFEAIAQIPGVSLVSLQKHAGVDQIEPNRQRVPLLELGPDVDESTGSFMDTAAVMMNLDLIITSDSAIAHLAGSLGVPVWTAIHFAPDWRWFLNRDDSPWYPTMRLFRQTAFGDWPGVFARLADAVRAELAQRDPSAVLAAVKGGTRSAITEANRGSVCFVPMSPGEMLDKISILRIKTERMTNPAQLENVRTELRALEDCRDELALVHGPMDHFVDQLETVNAALWQIEEEIRHCEKTQDFGDRFIELARSVYLQNDRRASLKRRINLSLGSQITEEKTHSLVDPSSTTPTLAPGSE